MVLSMARWEGKVAVVTGASAGIGAAIAQQLVEAGLKVVGLARRVERVQELVDKLQGKPGKLYAFKADVSVEADILSAFKWVTENVGNVHILVNNAGIIRSTTLIDGTAEDWKKVLDTNVLGLCICTREAIVNMRANNIDGHIVHISSLAAHTVSPVPNMNVYPATKHAVKALTESLRQELTRYKSKIKISSISPGYVDTEILYTNDVLKNPVSLEFLKGIADEPKLLSEDVVDAVIYALSTPPHVQVQELLIRPVGDSF